MRVCTTYVYDLPGNTMLPLLVLAVVRIARSHMRAVYPTETSIHALVCAKDSAVESQSSQLQPCRQLV